jgi:hypothetical protein
MRIILYENYFVEKKIVVHYSDTNNYFRLPTWMQVVNLLETRYLALHVSVCSVSISPYRCVAAERTL